MGNLMEKLVRASGKSKRRRKSRARERERNERKYGEGGAVEIR